MTGCWCPYYEKCLLQQRWKASWPQQPFHCKCLVVVLHLSTLSKMKQLLFAWACPIKIQCTIPDLKFSSTLHFTRTRLKELWNFLASSSFTMTTSAYTLNAQQLEKLLIEQKPLKNIFPVMSPNRLSYKTSSYFLCFFFSPSYLEIGG